ncbi:DUF2490 domain-containing protein [Mongoliitalea lutea]|uniref:DUF2490 domain-containing protein n=1 Tax=Mongoliitalea lutea TaxID=849756 RepID=A0A8J3CUR0_9BACT|nr:DUF2490 domain-containing protein [Mongoliitalea lutea]GHB26815.1 hypothetical protein GCM10008106_04400 [Mongoliitalea lutea]
MLKKIAAIMGIVLVFGTNPVVAQISEPGNWLIYFGNQNFANNKWVWHNEIQYRDYSLLGSREQLLLRTGVGRYLTENNNIVSGGYAFISTRPQGLQDGLVVIDDANAFQEHRLWQQYLTRQPIGKVLLTHRYRFEQRFFNDGDFRLRGRYFLAANIPLNNQLMMEKTYYLSFYNEVFLNVTDDTSVALFDRNRLFGAIGYQVNRGVRVEVGLMHQTLNNREFSRTQLQFVVFNNLPFKK